jgi:hypothetical protein
MEEEWLGGRNCHDVCGWTWAGHGHAALGKGGVGRWAAVRSGGDGEVSSHRDEPAAAAAADVSGSGFVRPGPAEEERVERSVRE